MSKVIKLKADNIFDLFWFFGKVEDRNDPMELGRLRVRVYGIHTPDKVKDQFKGIPTDELLWSQPVMGIRSAAMNGIGDSPSGAVEGTMVFGFFLDGRLAQDPFVLGTLAGIPVDGADPTQGFNDPKGVYPKYLNESDVSRLARTAYMTHPGLSAKFNNMVKDIPSGADEIANTGVPGSSDTPGTKWSEPAPANSPRYPYNKVRETEAGHIEEYDDSPGAERMHWMHGPSGTYEEWRPDGSKSAKTNGDEVYIIIGNKKHMVSGDSQITIVGNAKILVQGNLNEQVNGNVQRFVKGNVVEKIEGNFSRDVLGESFTNVQGNVVQRDGSNRTNFTAINKTTTVGANNSETINGKNAVQCLGDWTVTSAAKFTHITGGNHAQLISGNYSINVASAYGLATAQFSVGVAGSATIDATGPATIMGSRVDLN
jgi:hypothetical protein